MNRLENNALETKIVNAIAEYLKENISGFSIVPIAKATNKDLEDIAGSSSNGCIFITDFSGEMLENSNIQSIYQYREYFVICLLIKNSRYDLDFALRQVMLSMYKFLYRKEPVIQSSAGKRFLLRGHGKKPEPSEKGYYSAEMTYSVDLLFPIDFFEQTELETELDNQQ
jgi:hypothetical protein